MNGSVLEYRGYFTSVKYSAESRVLFGKIEMISDLVTFESDRADEVENAFHEAVDDYLLMCEDLNKEPNKPYKGSFNVRITPELHKHAVMVACKSGLTLNQFVGKAIETAVSSESNSLTKGDLQATEDKLVSTIYNAADNCWQNVQSTVVLKDLKVHLNG